MIESLTDLLRENLFCMISINKGPSQKAKLRILKQGCDKIRDLD